jgi:hypothetical protein
MSATIAAVSSRKLQANRANAAKSTGPKTADGKAKSSQNRLCHGFYSKQLLLPGEDPRELEQLRQELMTDLRPCGAMQVLLVDRLVAAHWRLRRLQRIEQLVFDENLNQCRRHMASQDATPDAALLRMTCSSRETSDRLSVYQNRLDHSIHRILRELRLLRKEHEQHEQDRTPCPLGGEGGGEGEEVQTHLADDSRIESEASTPHPNPLPQGERESIVRFEATATEETVTDDARKRA